MAARGLAASEGQVRVPNTKKEKILKIIRNAAKCLQCDEVIESKHPHDFVRCHCENIFIDGGISNPRRGFRNDQWVNLIEYEEED